MQMQMFMVHPVVVPPKSHLLTAAGVLSTFPGMEMVVRFLNEQGGVAPMG